MLAYCNKLQLTKIAITKSRMLAFWYELARPTLGAGCIPLVLSNIKGPMSTIVFFFFNNRKHPFPCNQETTSFDMSGIDCIT